MLAAGSGRRLRPLTELRPKALCPVGNVALVDLALARVAGVVPAGAVAVNAHHLRHQLGAHLAGRVHLSVEEPQALGTAGAVANLRGWLDGRAVLVVNADAWHTADLAPLVAGWDGARVRVLVVADPEPPDLGPTSLGPTSRVLGSLLPWSEVVSLPMEPSGLYEASWRPHQVDGTLDVAASHVRFVDCGTPGDYLAANLASSGGESVVGDGAVVEGTLVRSVVWPGGVVRRGEVLVDAIRVGESLTVRSGGFSGP